MNTKSPVELAVEAVALAIATEDGVFTPLGYFPNGTPMRDAAWDDFMPEQHERWRAMARKALAALQALPVRQEGEERGDFDADLSSAKRADHDGERSSDA